MLEILGLLFKLWKILQKLEKSPENAADRLND